MTAWAGAWALAAVWSLVAVCSLLLIKSSFRQDPSSCGRLALAHWGTDLALWDRRLDTGEIYYDERWGTMLGYEPGELKFTSETWASLLHPEDLEESERLMSAHLAGDSEFYEAEHRMRTKDGRWRWIHDRGKVVVRDRNGRPLRIVGTHRDVTDRKEAVSSLRSIVGATAAHTGDAFFRSLVTEMASALRVPYVYVAEVIEGDPRHMRVLAVSQNGVQGVGLDIDISGTPCEEVTANQSLCVYETGLSALFPGDERVKELGATSYLGVPLFDVRENVIGVFAMMDGRSLASRAHAVDLLRVFAARAGAEIERRRTRIALRANEERFSQLARNIPCVIYRCHSSSDHEMVYVNDRIEQLTGRSKTEFLTGKLKLAELVHSDDLGEMHAEILCSVAEKRAYHLLYRLRHASGEWRWVEENGLAVGEEATMLDGFILDITERVRAEQRHRRLEEKVQHAQRLESLGVLAGGIAHDFNNLLVGILGNAALAAEELPRGSQLRPYLDGIDSAARRAAELSGQMLAYSGKGRFVVEPFAFNELVESIIESMDDSTLEAVSLDIEFDATLPRVEGDMAQIRQVMRNLLSNACDAAGEQGGVITIRTSAREVDDSLFTTDFFGISITPGSYACIEVRDTGCGMNETVLRRLFDPFFTTKSVGRGLGMAAVLGIVRGHHGFIQLESAEGVGSTFCVMLPVSGASEVVVALDALPPADPQFRGKVLVVDDEEDVRVVAEKILAMEGYEVVLAEDGDEAVRLYQESAGGVDVVLLDLTMPRQSGEDTFRQLRAIDSNLAVVISSGYSEHEVVSRFAGLGLAGFVQKPYMPSELASAVERAQAEL